MDKEIDDEADPNKPTAGEIAPAADSETFIQWLLSSRSDEAFINELAAFVRAAEGAPRNGSPIELAEWMREHGSPIRHELVEQAADLWSVRRRAGG